MIHPVVSRDQGSGSLSDPGATPRPSPSSAPPSLVPPCSRLCAPLCRHARCCSSSAGSRSQRARRGRPTPAPPHNQGRPNRRLISPSRILNQIKVPDPPPPNIHARFAQSDPAHPPQVPAQVPAQPPAPACTLGSSSRTGSSRPRCQLAASRAPLAAWVQLLHHHKCFARPLI